MARPNYQPSQVQPSEARRQFLEAWHQLSQEGQDDLLKEKAQADLLHVLLTGEAQADLLHVVLTGEAQAGPLSVLLTGDQDRAPLSPIDAELPVSDTESIASLASTTVSETQELSEIVFDFIISLSDFASQLSPFTALIQGTLDSRKERKIKAEEFAQAFGEGARYLRYVIDEIEPRWYEEFLPSLKTRRAKAWKDDLQTFFRVQSDLLCKAGVEDRHLKEWMQHLPSELEELDRTAHFDDLFEQLKAAHLALDHLSKDTSQYNITKYTWGALSEIGSGIVLIAVGQAALPAVMTIPIIGCLPAISMKVGTNMVIKGVGKML